MNKELISLRSQSYEAEVILKNFASRKRVHKDKEVNIHRLYLDMTNRGLKLSRNNFNKVFTDLERFGYGIIVGTNRDGDPILFLPETNIKSIGLDSMEILKPLKNGQIVQPMPVPPIKVGLEAARIVMVVIIKGGQKITAYVPESEVETFTAKMA